jgi:hypothetical protein
VCFIALSRAWNGVMLFDMIFVVAMALQNRTARMRLDRALGSR